MKNIWRFFLFIFIFVTLFFIVLTNGIRIENLNVPNIKIKQLYIKLDKKLIVTADTIDINIKSKSKTSLNELKLLTDKTPLLHAFFKTISIQNLIFNNNTVHFLYKNEIFYVDSDFLTIDANIRPFKNNIELEIHQIFLKDYETKLKGVLKIDTKKKLFNFRGNFQTFNIDGGIELRVQKNILYYKFNTKKFKTLKPFMDFVSQKANLEPLISAWIYKKIVASQYILHNLEGKLNLKTFEYYPLSMKGQATGKNAIINFDDKAPNAIVNDLDVILKNDQLVFDVKKANYEGKNVSKTKVHIYNLMSKGAGIVVDLKANTILDESIHKALRAFNIIVPITQTAGKTEANVLLDIGFLPFEVKSYTGSFKIKDANLTLAGLPIHSKSGTVRLDNGIVYIDKANLQYKKLFNIYTSGKFDITNGVYASQNFIESLHVELGNSKLLDIKDTNTSATLELNENTTIKINDLDTILTFRDTNNTIEINNIALLHDYSKLMKDVKLKEGKLLINTSDFNHYDILANLKGLELPLQRDGKDIKDLDLLVTVDGTEFKAHTIDEDIKVVKNDEVKIDIRYMDVTFDSSDINSSFDIGKITVEGVNSNIIDTNSSLIIPSNHFTYKLDGSNMTFNNQMFAQKMFIEQTEKTLYLSSENLTAEYMNSLLSKKIFENGSFKLSIDGVNSKLLDGTLTVQNTTIKGMSFYNNLMAFIQTIPSLVTFKNPGFNDNGYKVTYAHLDFNRDGDIITINELKMDGESADITGIGTINLATDELDITLQISVFKNLSSIVNAIPLVNYIFLGEDGKIYTEVNIRGKLKNLEIATNIIQDTALSPLGIIKRTIETPFRIFQ